ncbi:MAG: site-specific integrase [Vulcanimicrobiaceae bacterium]
MSDLPQVSVVGLPLVTALDVASRTEIAEHYRAANTQLAYRKAWGSFSAFCREIRRASLPAGPSTVRLYITYCLDARTRVVRDPDGHERRVPAPLSLPSIGVHLAAIAHEHHAAGLSSPVGDREVQVAWESVRRGREHTPRRRRALVATDLRPILDHLGRQAPIDLRDRALLAIGFLGGLRRSELAGMTWESLEITERGLRYAVGMQERAGAAPRRRERSKTDQYGGRRRVVLIVRDPDPELDAVRMLELWLAAGGVRDGWIWRSCSNRDAGHPLSPAAVSRIVQRRVGDALVAWLDAHARHDERTTDLRDRHGRIVRSRLTPERIGTVVATFQLPTTYDPREYGAHSLRRGMITTARRRGDRDHAIIAQTGHASVQMLDRYTEASSSWADSVSVGLLHE